MTGCDPRDPCEWCEGTWFPCSVHRKLSRKEFDAMIQERSV